METLPDELQSQLGTGKTPVDLASIGQRQYNYVKVKSLFDDDYDEVLDLKLKSHRVVHNSSTASIVRQIEPTTPLDPNQN